MKVSIQKWGNSLALRIPHLLAKEAHLAKGAKADLRFTKGKLVLMSLARKEWTLSMLLAGVKKENLHGETQTGRSIGREIW